MHMMHGYGSMWPMILMVIFWIGIISFGVYLITNFVQGNSKRTPLQIINKRLAKGEIDASEYERLKSMIEQDEK